MTACGFVGRGEYAGKKAGTLARSSGIGDRPEQSRCPRRRTVRYAAGPGHRPGGVRPAQRKAVTVSSAAAQPEVPLRLSREFRAKRGGSGKSDTKTSTQPGSSVIICGRIRQMGRKAHVMRREPAISRMAQPRRIDQGDTDPHNSISVAARSACAKNTGRLRGRWLIAAHRPGR